MSSTLRSAFLVLALGLGTLILPTLSAAAETAATDQSNASKFVQVLGDRAISIIANPSITPQQRGEQFKQILSDSFDLKTIGRFVIGRSWNAATPEQQEEYMKLFQALVVKTYGDRLTLYTGEGFKVLNQRDESEQDVIVNSEITHPDGSTPTVIEWRVRNRNGKLGVIDVVVEGVSLSVTQRQEYSAVIQNNGGQIDGLLTLMRQRLQSPSPSQPG